MAGQADPTSKPALPASYRVPETWEAPQGGVHGNNRPTAGARSEAALPRGAHPLQLYSLGTPNGQKVTILLEELGVEYDAWRINIGKQEQFTSGFVEVNPNSKIPALVDWSESGSPLRVFESGSILLYLADREGKFIPKDPRRRVECLNWLFWQVASAPFIGGGFGHFYKYAPVRIEYAIDRYTMETKRQLDVLDRHLADKQYICGDEYTIADMAIMPWVRVLETGYNAGAFLGLDAYPHTAAWMRRLLLREPVQRGLRVNGFGRLALPERHSPEDFQKQRPRSAL